jgi:GNAT superfamily N-acetyltransferase
VRSQLNERWASPEVVTRGRLHRADRLPGFIALEGQRPVGLVTYSIENHDCENVTIDALEPRKGVGSALVRAVLETARAAGCRRVWLITTNDNTGALIFYQKVGFDLVALHRGAVERSRELKPVIPEVGCHGIPIRDEIELETRTQP